MTKIQDGVDSQRPSMINNSPLCPSPMTWNVSFISGSTAKSLEPLIIIGPIPKNAVAPTPWSIYAAWKPVLGDAGKEFLQKTEILWPDGTVFNTIETPFGFDANKNHQNTANVVGFPIGQAGDVTIKLWVEGDRKRIGEIHSWTIAVSHKQPPN